MASSTRSFRLLFASCAVAISGFYATTAQAQFCEPCQVAPVETYRFVPKTVVENQEVTSYKAVEETSTKTREVTSLKPVIRTEQRERRYSVLKPVVETEMQTRRRTVMEPVTETVMEKRTRTVTEYVEETGFREVQEVVPRTVEETQMRERQVVVSKPVTETQYRQTPVTSYRPVTTYRQELVNQGAVVNQLVTTPGDTRNRLRFLSGTQYIDPVTSQQVYRRPGFYWVNQGQPATTAIVPTYVNNYQVAQVPQTSYVPETTMNTEAVEVTRYMNEVVTEKVPVTVQRVENEVVTRKVPYTVRRPVTREIVEEVPVQRTRYQERVIEEQVPIQRTTYQRIEKVEPYDVQIKEFEKVTTTEQVPVTERRLVPVKEVRPVQKTVMFRERLDVYGNPISSEPVGGYQPTPTQTWNGGSVIGSSTALPSSQTTPLKSIISEGGSTSPATESSGSTDAADQTPMLNLLRPLIEDTDAGRPAETPKVELESVQDKVDI